MQSGELTVETQRANRQVQRPASTLRNIPVPAVCAGSPGGLIPLPPGKLVVVGLATSLSGPATTSKNIPLQHGEGF